MKMYTYDEVLQAALQYFKGDNLAAQTWINKYAMRDKEGNLVEQTPEDMHRRMAKAFALKEEHYRYNVKESDQLKLSEYGYKREELTYEKIFNLFKNFKHIIPAGSVMSGIDNPAPVSLSNCWVIAPPGDSLDEIFRVCNEQSQLMKRRGGVGFDISKLRPSGAAVNNSAKSSTGAASFMDLFSHVTNTIAQNGRRGALMLSISILHPDSLIFIEKKQDLSKVTGANVSVQIPDEFMEAVIKDEDVIQRWPIDATPNIELTEKMNGKPVSELEYNKLYPMAYTEGELSSTAKHGYLMKIKAKELWDKLIHCAWNTAEPGIIFQTKHHNYSPDGVYPSFKGSCTNPCVTGDTIVITDKGELAVKDIVKRFEEGEAFNILSYDINKRKAGNIFNPTEGIEFNKLLNAQLTKKNAEIIKVTYKLKPYYTQYNTLKEKSICLTPDHKVYTIQRGYIEAKDLTENDELIFLYKNKDNEFITAIANIVNINTENNADVYDLTIDRNHNLFGNQVLIKNCGEIFMHEDSCRLIHINLTSFVETDEYNCGKLNETKLYETTYEAMRLADDLVDLEEDAIHRIMKKIVDDGDKGNSEYNLYDRLLKHSLEGRRCGLGFTGLADTIALLGYKYDSEESLEMIKHIMRLMFIAEMDSMIDMAITRGKFPGYDKSLEEKGNLWYDTLKKDMPQLYEKMMKFGRRNVSFNTVAPTGTVSLMAQCSSGIEPIFMPYYTRRVKCMKPSDRVDFIDNVGEKFTEYVTVHPGLLKWANNNNLVNGDMNVKQWQQIYEKSPWFKSTANDIDWEKRVKLQGIVQHYISHSISSTVNLPNNVSEEDVSIIYMKAWEDGLKGITVYRDGCRAGVMVSTDNKKENDKKENPLAAKRRPKSLPCKVIRFTNKGEKWIGVVGILDGQPYEIFTGLQENLSIPNWVTDGEIVRNKEDGHSRYDICYLDKEGYKVCIQGLSRISNPEYWNYGKLISGLLRHHMEIQYIIKVISSLKLDDSINAWKNGIIRTLQKFEDNHTEVQGEKCPECGGTLIREGGCIHCKDCGWTRCE